LDAVIANNRHMMEMLAQNRRKQPIDQLDEQRFASFIQSIGVMLETQKTLGELDR
jgi:hypothetical protein